MPLALVTFRILMEHHAYIPAIVNVTLALVCFHIMVWIRPRICVKILRRMTPTKPLTLSEPCSFLSSDELIECIATLYCE